MILVGSKALKELYSDFSREIQDTDFFVQTKLSESSTRKAFTKDGDEYQFFTAPELSILFERGDNRVATLNELFTIKCSHVQWDIKRGGSHLLNKTLFDIKFMLQKGAKLDEELYSSLYSLWEKRYGVNLISFNAPNEIFFTKAVDRKYDHDSLHELVKYYDEPLHCKVRKDKSKALVSKKLFDQLSPLDQLRLAREECYVLSLERFIIPGKINDYKVAYKKTLHRFIGTMSKGFFNKFLLINYLELEEPEINYLEKFQNAI